MNPSLRRLWQKINALWAWFAPQRRGGPIRRSATRQPAAAYQLARELQQAIRDLASRLGRSEDEVAGDLLARVLQQRRQADYARLAWSSLTGRERQVAELLCQDLSYRQIAALLAISPGTVRAYTRLVLAKLGLRSRDELQALGNKEEGIGDKNKG